MNNDNLLRVYSEKIAFSRSLSLLSSLSIHPKVWSGTTTTTLGQLQRPAASRLLSVPKDHHPSPKRHSVSQSIQPIPISPPKDKIQGRLSFRVWLGSLSFSPRALKDPQHRLRLQSLIPLASMQLTRGRQVTPISRTASQS